MQIKYTKNAAEDICFEEKKQKLYMNKRLIENIKISPLKV